MTSRAHVGFSLILATGVVAGCGGAMNLGRATSPWEQYRSELEATGLDDTAMGRDWIAAGERALTSALIAELPFQETG